MAAMYKRVNKSIENLDGFVELTDENPFLQPCLLCLSAQTGVDKSVFGITKAGVSLARLRVRNLYNAGFDIEQVPINFLASRVSSEDEDIAEFVEKYFIPLVMENGQRKDPISASKMLRNINVMTYCDGTLKTLKMERYLSKRLMEIGYSSDEINLMLQQIAVVPIATDRVQGSEKMSVFSFKDINDLEVLTQKEVPFYEGQEQSMFISMSPNVCTYMYKGNGEHDLKKYTYREDVLAYLSFVVTSILENSVVNANNEKLIPLNMVEIFRRLKAIASLPRERILEQIDQSLSYGGAPRMTKREALLLDKLDVSFDKIKKTTRDLGYLESRAQTQSKQLEGLQDAIRENCSSVNALRILLEGIGWQVSKEQLEEIMSTPSDKEIVAGLSQERGLKK